MYGWSTGWIPMLLILLLRCIRSAGVKKTPDMQKEPFDIVDPEEGREVLLSFPTSRDLRGLCLISCITALLPLFCNSISVYIYFLFTYHLSLSHSLSLFLSLSLSLSLLPLSSPFLSLSLSPFLIILLYPFIRK